MRKLSNPLLWTAVWLFKLCIKHLGSEEYRNKKGFQVWHWVTPYVENLGYRWELSYPNKKSVTTNKSGVAKTGRVVQAKSKAEYTPGASNRGGRVVRQVPKQLKKIKDAQNEVRDVQE